MEKIYFIGINGIGMSGLAKIMKCKGYDVKGADICSNYVTEELLSMGITVYNEHDEENVKGADYVIASTAIKETNPEYAYAKENGIKILKRGELLAKLLNRETGIAIAGTHGKTTTSSMLSAVMLKKDPTIVVGGILPEIKSNARPGKSEYFIAEADESDNSFLFMNPEYSVITNIDADHLDVHGNLDNIKKSFIEFILHTQKESIICMDSKNLMDAISKLPEGKSVTTYSIKDENADIYAKNIRIVDRKTVFEVYVNKELKNYLKFYSEDLLERAFQAIKQHDKQLMRTVLDTTESYIETEEEQELFEKFKSKILRNFQYTKPAEQRGFSHAGIGIMES